MAQDDPVSVEFTCMLKDTEITGVLEFEEVSLQHGVTTTSLPQFRRTPLLWREITASLQVALYRTACQGNHGIMNQVTLISNGVSSGNPALGGWA